MTNVSAALFAGFFGALICANLMYRLNISPVNGDSFELLGWVWYPAYLVAYAIAILVQILVCRSRDRNFTQVHIAVAFIVAFPGSILVFYLPAYLFLYFLSRLLGQH
jgi:cyanate permease